MFHLLHHNKLNCKMWSYDDESKHTNISENYRFSIIQTTDNSK